VLASALARLPRVLIERAGDTRPRVLNDRAIFGQGWAPDHGEPFDAQSPTVRLASGWHGLEDGERPFRWTTAQARGFVWLGDAPAEVRLRGSVPSFLLDGRAGVRLSLSLADGLVHERRVEQAGPFEIVLPATAGAPGWRELALQVERAYCPAQHGHGADVRQLAVQVFSIDVTPSRA
jgi:hypothetical protein